MNSTRTYDVALIGAGVMSATLGTLLKHLAPNLRIIVLERLDAPALESSNPWNNAGTGHAALCELNYMPDSADGSLPNPAKAIAINEQFQLTRQFWSSLVTKGTLKNPETFIHSCPHMTFVKGAKDVDYLERRFEALKNQPLFSGMQFSKDPKQIAAWSPLLIDGRTSTEPIAATRIESGTDVDFGAVTNQLFDSLKKLGVEIQTNTEIQNLKRTKFGWRLKSKALVVDAKFVFVGAGGWALKLLQNSGIPEAKGYGTFPISGAFLRTDNQQIVAKHQAKVYSQAAVGAPPMSVPHLDTRIVDGKPSLLFGPFAGANPKFLKEGSVLDLPLSVRPSNLMPYLSVALKNLGLLRYLILELLKTKKAKFASLQEFMPSAKPEDWYSITAGQRAQVIKRDSQGRGILQFGTEVIASADGTIAGLLGASPGASTAVPIMIEVLQRCFKDEFASWTPALKELIPYFGKQLSADPKLAAKCLAETAKTLKLK